MPSEKSSKRERFAIYARYSSEMQNEKSLDDQIAVCRKAIAARGGVVVDIFTDEAKSGWSLDRPGFNRLKEAAGRKNRKFDAVMFWKFDRLARDHEAVIIIKMLLCKDFGVKLFCVEGYSEDDDNSPMGMMMEQMLSIFSAYYSNNLSSDTKRAKRRREETGEFNGSSAPLGYVLVRVNDATPELPAGLYIDPLIAPIVIEAFEKYATGAFSDRDVADWMNTLPEIQMLRANQKPIGKEMIRDMLQNRTYTGRVPYAETEYTGTLGNGKKSSRRRKEWFDGKHEPLISDELFELCVEARKANTKVRHASAKVRTYLLHDRVYCARCAANEPHDLHDDRYGKMRPTWIERDNYGYYRCLTRERGYADCGQSPISVRSLDEQVLDVLLNLEIPNDFRSRVEVAVRSRIENEAALKRMEELKDMMRRMDVRYDRGHVISLEEHMEQREELQQEYESLKPVDYEDLTQAGDLLENFGTYWQKCETMENPDEARQQLLKNIVHRVYVFT